jgi:hypothetical protein
LISILSARPSAQGVRNRSADAAPATASFGQFLKGASGPSPGPARSPSASAQGNGPTATAGTALPDTRAHDKATPVDPASDGPPTDPQIEVAAGLPVATPKDAQNAGTAGETAAVVPSTDDTAAGDSAPVVDAANEPTAVLQATLVPAPPGNQTQPQGPPVETTVEPAAIPPPLPSAAPAQAPAPSELTGKGQLSVQPAGETSPQAAFAPPASDAGPELTNETPTPGNTAGPQQAAAAPDPTTPKLPEAPVAGVPKLPEPTPTQPAAHPQTHRAAASDPSTSASPRDVNEAPDDSPPVPEVEHRSRPPAERAAGSADAPEDAPAKPHGRATLQFDVRVDESSAPPKPIEARDATSAARLPELFGSVPGAATPAAPAATVPSPADVAPIQIAGIAVEIAARAQAGRNRFEIRLDPPELGRIDVRLDVDNSGNVTSRLVVERVETLEILRRDAGELQRALQDAGLKTSDNGLQFTLRDQNFAGRNDRAPTQPSARLIIPDASVPETVPDYGRVIRRGLDIRV